MVPLDGEHGLKAKLGRPSPLGRMIHLLMLLLLVGLWGVVAAFTWKERESTLARISDQLATTVITLADFNELAEQAATLGLVQDTDTRTEALWRALLQYPALSLWFESDGVLSAGLPPESAVCCHLAGGQPLCRVLPGS